MSVLVVGGDRIDSIIDLLRKELDAERIEHFSARKRKIKSELVRNVDLVVFLVDYLNHDAMYKLKNTAKKEGVPFIATHSVSHLKQFFLNKRLGKKNFVYKN